VRVEGYLKKEEALAVMHEVLDVLHESVVVSSVSLDLRSSRVSKDQDNGDYLIRIRCDMDKYSADCLKPSLEKHNLLMAKESGFVIISKIHR
jgi:hypothetical protein